ncbi:MAG TPA: fibronectin [bacterium]|nr:fibronectin [bacterium]HOX85026.1 fibronectin [bacterium]HPG44108.1 fibronectin [bacterium]HPM96474.1 fibronectin [bacterium]
MNRLFLYSLIFLHTIVLLPGGRLFAQVEGIEKRYVRIGQLQSHFTAYGSERAWNNVYYEGMRWPADYSYTDNAVIKRAWITCKDFIDAKNTVWNYYGIPLIADLVDDGIFPMELYQTAKFEPPLVFVDGTDITAPYAEDIDAINPDQIPDRIVTNIVNTSMGLTMNRTIYAFSQQYHDSYFIKIFTFTNTGNTDYDAEIERTGPLNGVRIGWSFRYSVCYEGSFEIGGPQSYGKYSWCTKRGENYQEHFGESITEANPIVDWLRCGFQWAGQSDVNSFDNIGGPQRTGPGRLTAPQHAGVAIIHVDKSATDKTDDPNQPAVLGWHAGDTYPKIGSISPLLMPTLTYLYGMMSGIPYAGLGGTDRFDETYMQSHSSPYTVHNDGGGTNVWICYGPFDLQPGESVTIVEAEGVNGLDRAMCEKIGQRWRKAYADPNDKGPFELPNGTTTTDKDEYKNSWVYTGKDSIMMIFGRAKRNFDAGYNIPQPPLPPPLFDIKSGGDRISLSWSPSPSTTESGVSGYKIYRAVGRKDTTYTEIHDGPASVTNFDDLTAIRGFSYYYYLLAYNDGSNNTSGATNPTGPLYSGRFYTQTSEPAFLRRKAGDNLDAIRIVPNPFNIKAKDLQYTGEPDKIMFLNIPAYCTIRIYTERGDLIKTIEHTDGSGDEAWNSVTSSRQVIVSGIYIVHFEVTEDYRNPETGEILYKKGETTFRKLIVIR